MNGNSSKSPTIPPLPLRGTSPKGGSKGAEHHPQRGQQANASKAPLKGELAGPKGLTEGFRGRHPQFYETTGKYVAPHLAPQWGSWQAERPD